MSGEAQKAYRGVIHDSDLTFALGPAGTGKTHNAVMVGCELLKRRTVQRMVLVRPAVEAGEKLGFLPGGLEEKVSPYMRPIYDALESPQGLGRDKLDYYLSKGLIEIAPVAFLRGRTLHDAFVLVDEAQNLTPQQLFMILTRFGEGSKMVIAADTTQVDLPGGRTQLAITAKKLAGLEGVRLFEFALADVMRHPLVAAIIERLEGADSA